MPLSALQHSAKSFLEVFCIYPLIDAKGQTRVLKPFLYKIR